ncbi:DUF4082 domain-containing protein [Nocardioides sp. NPDC101246]|uniref:DUF4082 domain-containing protein n=1 Tax=Nocardioides sp. NPDC101246 TaxID=3364336 RepID=UPI003809265C
MRARLFSETSILAVSGDPGQPYNFGTRFSPTVAASAVAVWFHWGSRSTPGSGIPMSDVDVGIANSGGTILGSTTGVTVTRGWNRVELSSPVALTIGQAYMAVVKIPDGTWFSLATGMHSSERTSNGLTFPANAGAFNVATTLTAPTNSDARNFGVDVECTVTVTPPTLTGSAGTWDMAMYGNQTELEADGWDMGGTSTGTNTYSSAGVGLAVTSTAQLPDQNVIWRDLPDGWRSVEIECKWTPGGVTFRTARLGVTRGDTEWTQVAFNYGGFPCWETWAPADPLSDVVIRPESNKDINLDTITAPRYMRIDRTDDDRLVLMFSEDENGRSWLKVAETDMIFEPEQFFFYGSGATTGTFTIASVTVGTDPLPPPLASGTLIKAGEIANLRIGGQVVTAGYLNGEWIYQPTLTGSYVGLQLEAPSFRPWVELLPGSTAQCMWTLEDNKVFATGDKPTIDFGVYAEREMRLYVLDGGEPAFDQVSVLNLGFSHLDDPGTYGPGPTYDWAPQPVVGITNLGLLTGLTSFMAANSVLKTVDFSGMADLEFIECFHAEIETVDLTGCNSIIRLCLESCQLDYLDMNPISDTVKDVRCAATRHPSGTLTLEPITGTMAQEYHYCVRDQVIVNHIPLSKQPVLEERWDWNTNESTIDFANMPATVDSFQSYGNPWDEATVNGILIKLDDDGPAIGLVDLSTGIASSGVPAAPTGAGITAKNNLIAKGWTVLTN